MVNGKKANLTKAMCESSLFIFHQNASILGQNVNWSLLSSACWVDIVMITTIKKRVFFLFLNIPPGLVLRFIFSFPAKNNVFDLFSKTKSCTLEFLSPRNWSRKFACKFIIVMIKWNLYI